MCERCVLRRPAGLEVTVEAAPAAARRRVVGRTLTTVCTRRGYVKAKGKAVYGVRVYASLRTRTRRVADAAAAAAAGGCRSVPGSDGGPRGRMSIVALYARKTAYCTVSVSGRVEARRVQDNFSLLYTYLVRVLLATISKLRGHLRATGTATRYPSLRTRYIV